ncbi:MAG TPA: RDD family protein, partial [Longimicrobium sp.]|nr:RDD family protein [Longimicrobium sp.]
MPPSTAAAHVLYDRLVDVETPEHVAIGYELADLGSRFTAMLLDFLLAAAVQLGIWLSVLIIQWRMGASGAALEGMGTGLVVAVSFLMQWGYFMLYEGLRDGQTPGKRWMGIR